MKKITLLVLFLFTITLTSFAQDVSMVKSEIFKDSKKHSSLAFSLEDGNGGIVTIRSFRKSVFSASTGYYIQHFDSNLKILNETELIIERGNVKNAFIKDNQIHLITFKLNKKSESIVFDVESANINDLKFSKSELISFNKKNMQKYFGFVIFPFFINNLSQMDSNHAGEVVFSENKKFFAINFDIKNKNKEIHKVFVFNDSFEKVYENKIKKNIKDRLFDYNSFDIDGKDGTVYFLGKVFENNSRKSKKKGKTNYHFELYKLNASGQSHTSFKNPDKFITSLELIKSDNKLSCVGFYGKKMKQDIMVFVLSI